MKLRLSELYAQGRPPDCRNTSQRSISCNVSPGALVTASSTPPLQAELNWAGDLRFEARSGRIALTVDSASLEGPSPMQALALALAGCMAMDVVHILRKGRLEPAAVRVTFSGHRAPEQPSRFTAIALHFVVTGPIPAESLTSALDLSHEKFCSVWHSMRSDIELTLTSETHR